MSKVSLDLSGGVYSQVYWNQQNLGNGISIYTHESEPLQVQIKVTQKVIEWKVAVNGETQGGGTSEYHDVESWLNDFLFSGKFNMLLANSGKFNMLLANSGKFNMLLANKRV